MKKWILRILAASVLLWIAYTLFSFFSITDLCDLASVNPKTTAFMDLKKEQWEEKGVRRKIDQRWIPLSRISRHLKNAVIVTEDPNFYSHHGLDFGAIWMAVETNIEEGEVSIGASTITQQLMKNLYLSPSRNPFRKWREAILSFRVERCVKKGRILEIYLNVIEWGDAVYGIEAASRKYFGKSASALGAAESALLAAMIRNPNFYNPYRSNPALIKNKNRTLKWMWRTGKLTKSEYQSAVNQVIALKR